MPVYKQELHEILAQIIRRRSLSGILGTAVLLIFASQLFATVRLVLNEVFGFTGGFGFVRGVIKDLLLLFLMGVLFLASIAITDVFGWVKMILMVPVMPGSGSSRWSSSCRSDSAPRSSSSPTATFPIAGCRWARRWPAPSSASLLWEVAKQLFRWYILSVGAYDKIYGPLGALVALSMFAYYSGVVFVLGAEFTAALLVSRPRVSRAAGRACAGVWRPDRQCSLPKGEVTMLKDKIAVVTGAARGIGREIALLMAKQGAAVVVNDYGGGCRRGGGDHTPADDGASTRSRPSAAAPSPTTSRSPA